MEEKGEQKHKFEMSRRNFLRAGATATALGVIGAIKAPVKVANAAVPSNVKFSAGAAGQWSKLHPEPDYGGATVRYAENNDQWLGTSKIVGTVKNISEADMGFALAARGLISDKAQRGFFNFVPKHPFGGAISWARTWIASEDAVDGQPAPEKLPIPDPEQMSQHIKDAAYFLRADEVGIGKMPPYAYYSHKIINPALLVHNPVEQCVKPFTERLPYVIVVMVDQHLETMLASTGYDGISASQSMRSYHATGNIAIILAKYIRSLGYHARAHHAANYGAVMGPCILASGLGELTRTGDCALHPRLGFRHKVAAVTTDLPLVPDKPIDFGLQDFCRVCGKCADNCPSGAITHDKDPVEHNGYLRWNTDMKKCTEFRVANEEGSSCGRCMKVCPWNSKENSWFHQAGLFIGSHGETSSKFLKSIDDMFGYGTEQIEKYKWWLEWPELYKVAPGLPPNPAAPPATSK
ncbi:MAG: reductive dehalogenase [Peptococcaceae bacterium]|nr:reductive dehalogenase [Peptococcaceae bacterium]